MPGFTLIEAAAALAICSTAVVTLIGVRSRLVDQAMRASETATANVMAGELVARWRMGELTVSPGEQDSGANDDGSMRYLLTCDRMQVDGTLLHRLKVQIFAADGQDPVVQLTAWKDFRRPEGG